MTVFSGCQDNGKNSREFIEGKAAKLSKVYPTKDLFDLFDKFPDGFEFETLTYFDEDDDSVTSQELKLEGNSETKEIKGTIVEDRTKVDKNGESTVAVHFKSDVIYTKEGFVFSNPDVDESDLRHKDFLIQKFTINKESLSKLQMIRKSYSWETGAADIIYALQDKTVNQFLSLNENEKISMQITMNEYVIHGNSFGYNIIFKREETDYVETIRRK